MMLVLSDDSGVGLGGTFPWPELLQHKLGTQILNNSEAGRTVSGGAFIIQSLLARETHTHLIVLLGSNDIARGQTTEAIKRMQEIVRIARAHGVKPIIGTLPPNHINPTDNELVDQLSNAYRQLSGAVIADINRKMANDDAYFIDGVHLNNEGQNLIANIFSECIFHNSASSMTHTEKSSCRL